ncbi:DUF4065 domain-containing protein [Priestia filamentosa]|uniref:type II TA system antitoxin MqsA family protein n=1 Tax=Priestia filamentosa TaxID=1402861 RepID=UPI003983BB0B
MNRQVYCDSCKAIRSFKLSEQHMDYYVKDEAFTILGKHGICANCGHEVFDIKMERDNQAKAFDLYREKHKLVFVNDIIETRKKYGLNQKEYSLLLGLGEIQITRYERGSLPNPAHSMLIKQSKDPMFMRKCIEQNGHKVDKQLVERLLNELDYTQEVENEIIKPIRNMMSLPPSEQNGFQKYNWHKIKNLIAYFSKEQVPHFTAMCKLLFYSDFYHFHEYGTSITGSRYVRMPYGPCPERHQTIFESVPSVAIEPSPRAENGKILRLVEEVEFDFSREEWLTINFVNEKFNNKRSRDISDFSHEERAWLENENNAFISYEYAKYLDLQRQI